MAFKQVSKLSKEEQDKLHRQFLAWWLADPETRQPKSMNALAKSLGIRTNVFHRWSTRLRAPQEITDGSRWKDVENEVYKSAKQGSVKAMELYAKLKGKLVERSQVDITEKISFTAEQLDDIERRARKRALGNAGDGDVGGTGAVPA